MCLIFGLVSCGQKSVVKNDVDPLTFAQAYGDGKLMRKTFPLPITTDPMASPLPDFGFFFGGISKMFANLALALGAGRTEMYFHQQTPDLPDVVKEVRLKRVFFYIEPKPNGSRRANWINRVFRGKGNVDFNFISKLVLRVKPEKADMKKVCLLPDQGKYSPLFPCNDPTLTDEKTERYMSYFQEPTPEKEPDLSKLEEFVAVKYDGKRQAKSIMNDERGKMYMLRSKHAGETRVYFDNHPEFKGVIDNIMMLDNSVFIELKKDPVMTERFENAVAADATYIDETLGVEQIEECTPAICLDVKVEKANLLPFLKRMNSNRIEAFIDAGKVPETFALKGFLEIEAGFDIGF
ncbi:MAG: hypothetical protein ACJ76H_05500 [Bacteriovoracaceae bacterium]